MKSNRPSTLRHVVGATVLCSACIHASAAAQPETTEIEDARRQLDDLRHTNEDLRAQNRAMEKRLQALEPPRRPDPMDIGEAETDSAEYRFLDLGVDRDYLKQERWRIADQIKSFIPPLYEPVRPFHAYTLPPGAARISLSSRLTFNDSDFGRDKEYAKLFEHVEVQTQTEHLAISYGFELPHFPDLTATLDVPYKSVQLSGAGHPFRADAMVMSMDGSDAGLGDISLTFKQKWLDQANVGFNFATFAGVIFPTGKDDAEFNANQSLTVGGAPMPAPPLNIFSRTASGQLFPPGAQPGQGAWGLRIGGAATRQFTRSALHAGIIADLFLENDDIVPGHEVRYGVSYVFPPLKSDLLAIDLSVFGRYKTDSEFPGVGIMGPRANFKNGNVVFFSPSLILTPNPQIRFFASPEFRILEPDKGPSPEFALFVGMTITF